MAFRRPPHFAWWWGNRAYTLFVIRELTSVFIGAYAVLLLVLVQKLGQGRVAYEAYLRWLTTPWMVLFHLAAFAAAIYHSCTWFALTPKAMTVRIGEKRVAPRVVVGVNYVAWIVISTIVAWILLRS